MSQIPFEEYYAASPSGKHRRLAKYYFGLAKRASRAGNRRAAATALRLGRAALYLSQQEWRMWKRGQRLSKAASGLKANLDTKPFVSGGDRRNVEPSPHFYNHIITRKRYKIPLTIISSERHKGPVEIVDPSFNRP